MILSYSLFYFILTKYEIYIIVIIVHIFQDINDIIIYQLT